MSFYSFIESGMKTFYNNMCTWCNQYFWFRLGNILNLKCFFFKARNMNQLALSEKNWFSRKRPTREIMSDKFLIIIGVYGMPSIITACCSYNIPIIAAMHRHGIRITSFSFVTFTATHYHEDLAL